MTPKASLSVRLLAASTTLGVLLVACLALALWWGAVDLTPGRIIREIVSHISTPREEGTVSILWDLRLPRALLAAVVGAVLAAGGAALQGLLGNPLAEPYTVGVSFGCVLGASLAVVLKLDASVGQWIIPMTAFVSGIGAVGLVFVLGRRAGRLDVNTFLLSGIIVGALFWALTIFILSAAREDIARIFMWIAGSLNSPYPWPFLGMAFRVGIVTLAGLLYFARDLNAYALGEESARQLGVEPERLKAVVIGLVTLGTAACVSAVGVIGFVGLMVPHGMRRLFGSDHRMLIVTSAIGGACLMVSADALARGLAPPREIPIGVITAVIGAPVFLYVLNRGKT